MTENLSAQTFEILMSPKLLLSLLPISLCRIRTKIVDPYNKIVARTAQLARLQVCFLLSPSFCIKSHHISVGVSAASVYVSAVSSGGGRERLPLQCLIASLSHLIPAI